MKIEFENGSSIETILNKKKENIKRSQIKRMGVQQGLSLDDIIKVVQEPENSKNKLLELKDKYNISDKDFENFLFYASMYNMTKY